MAVSYGISVDLTGVAKEAAFSLQAAFPMMQQALHAIADETAFRWKAAVMKAPLWQGEKEKYIQSIDWSETGALEVTIRATYPGAEGIETGRPPRDLKTALQTSLKVRRMPVGKHAGQRYLIIPFRHNTPGFNAHAAPMPEHVYEVARQLKPSRVIGKYQEANEQGKVDAKGLLLPVTRSIYDWGGKLPRGLVPKLKKHHRVDIYANMVRMDATPAGGPKSSAYMTFRTMGEWSKGWIVPAKPGLYLAQGVAQAMGPVATDLMQGAMKATVEQIAKA